MSSTSTTLEAWLQAREGRRLGAPGLAGLVGRLLLVVDGKPLATLIVDDAYVQLVRDVGEADAVAEFVDGEALIAVLAGEFNPMVAALQGRMFFSTGNLLFATKTILGLQADKPFDAGEPDKEAHHAK